MNTKTKATTKKATPKTTPKATPKVDTVAIDLKEGVAVTVNLIEGLKKEDAMNVLFKEFGDFKKAEDYYKEFNTNGRTNSLEKKLADFLAFLEENPSLTEESMYTILLAEYSKNECRWVAQRNSIRKLANTVYKNLGGEFTEKLASAELKKQVKDKGLGK